jgi:hypothetical protein
MNKFQLECLAYLLVLILLTICAVKELRKIILDILYIILCKPFIILWIWIKKLYRKESIIHNPIENYNINTLELNIMNDIEEYESL